jgi:hypothetical protein
VHDSHQQLYDEKPEHSFISIQRQSRCPIPTIRTNDTTSSSSGTVVDGDVVGMNPSAPSPTITKEQEQQGG